MTAISAALETEHREGLMHDHPVQNGQKIYKGTPVLLDAADGYAQTNDGTTVTIALGDVFVGICDETVDNSSGSDGDKNVKVRKSGIFLMPISGTVSQAKMGDPVYMNNTTDNSTLTLTPANDGSDIQVGELVEMKDSDEGYVYINRCVGNRAGYDLPALAAVGEGIRRMHVAKATYDFSVDGGAVSSLGLGVTVPSGAIVYQALIHHETQVAGTGADIGVTLQTTDDLLADAGVELSPWSASAGTVLAGIPVGTAATAIILTADREITVEIEDAALTAGKFHVYVLYFL